MILGLFTIISFCVTLGIIIFLCVEFFRNRLDVEEFVGMCAMTMVLGVITCTPGIAMYLDSYGSYLDIKATYTTVVYQYRDSIEMYEDKAVLKMNKESFTDFKYQGYQENISELIKELRHTVEKYNRVYISKNGWKENVFVSWLIVPPDENMKLLSLTQ